TRALGMEGNPRADESCLTAALSGCLLIAGVVNAFDVRLRGGFKAEIFPLDARERECLMRLAQGHRLQRIADAMGLTDRQVEKLTISARRKLHATTLPQALATALIFELIAL
ncbi:LuxR C-terminal-related transcriptional regulator, partial [Azospirillum isscasi]